MQVQTWNFQNQMGKGDFYKMIADSNGSKLGIK